MSRRVWNEENHVHLEGSAFVLTVALENDFISNVRNAKCIQTVGKNKIKENVWCR